MRAMPAASARSQSAVLALRNVAEQHGRGIRVVDEAADRDLYDPPTHEVVCTIAGDPSIEVQLFANGSDTVVLGGGAEFDVDREHLLAFVDAVIRGNMTLKANMLPPTHPSATLRVHLPGDVVYQDVVSASQVLGGRGWLSRVRQA